MNEDTMPRKSKKDNRRQRLRTGTGLIIVQNLQVVEENLRNRQNKQNSNCNKTKLGS